MADAQRKLLQGNKVPKQEERPMDKSASVSHLLVHPLIINRRRGLPDGIAERYQLPEAT